MKKAIGIIVLGLLWCNNSFAKEIILNCYKLDPEVVQSRAEILARINGTKIDSELDLQKKILHFDGNKFDIVSETQRKIVAKNNIKKGKIIQESDIIMLRTKSKSALNAYDVSRVIGKKAKKNFLIGEAIKLK